MGEPDRAVAGLQKLLSMPYEAPLASMVSLTPALLRLDPMFDPLRRFPTGVRPGCSYQLLTPSC
jgi:hypothetical protein